MSTDYKVVRVESKPQRREFMNLIWRIYKDDPNWIPPIIMNQEELVGFRPHPFYENAKCRAFTVEKQGLVVGRIVARFAGTSGHKTHEDLSVVRSIPCRHRSLADIV